MYSLFELLQAYKNNKHIIHTYINNHKIENYKDDDSGDNLILGMSVILFIILLLFTLGIWVWAVVILVKYWNVLPNWAQIIGIVGLLTGFGPVLTIIVVYIGKNNK